MTYEVIKTINGCQYRYQQETYRENGKVRTRSVYIGPVESGRRRGVTAYLRELVKKKARREDIGETETDMRERVAHEDAERSKDARSNDLLTADSISMDSIAEIAESQAAETTPAGESSSEAAGEADADAGDASDGDAGDGDAGP